MQFKVGQKVKTKNGIIGIIYQIDENRILLDHYTYTKDYQPFCRVYVGHGCMMCERQDIKEVIQQ